MGADPVDDHPSENPLPTVDPSEIDVSDWEVASPDLWAADRYDRRSSFHVLSNLERKGAAMTGRNRIPKPR